MVDAFMADVARWPWLAWAGIGFVVWVLASIAVNMATDAVWRLKTGRKPRWPFRLRRGRR